MAKPISYRHKQKDVARHSYQPPQSVVHLYVQVLNSPVALGIFLMTKQTYAF